MKHIEQHVWKNQETTFIMRFEEFLGKNSRVTQTCSSGTMVHSVRRATFSASALALVSFYYIIQRLISL
jgi:hypothetical protein